MIARMRYWWRALARRERMVVAAASVLVAIALTHVVAVEPAWRARARSAAEVPRLHEQLAQMEALREEVRLLRQKGFGSQGLSALQAAAEQSLAREGVGAVARADGERTIVVSAKGVPAANWLAWAEQFSREARVKIVRARLARAAAPGTVDAEMAFEIPER